MTEAAPRKKIEELENVERREILGGAATVLFLGKDATLPDIGWSLRNLKKAGDEKKGENEHIVHVLRDIAIKNGIHTYLAPVAVPQNGLLQEDLNFTEELDLGDGIKIKRGSDAEGTLLKDGEAFLVSPADCLTVVGQSDKGLIATHAGRDSLFNVNAPERDAIVENLVKILGQETKVWAGFGISSEYFLHNKDSQTHGDINAIRELLIAKKLGPFTIKDEKIDLYELLLSLLEKNGVDRENVTIDKNICTYSEVDATTGERKFFSRRIEVGSNLAIVYKN